MNGSHIQSGEKMVLLTEKEDALFVWRRQRFTRDGQQGVCCTIFRNESHYQSSQMIREAMGLAWRRWPGERLFTYVNPAKVNSKNGWVATIWHVTPRAAYP
jgi:hypothetical protein